MPVTNTLTNQTDVDNLTKALSDVLGEYVDIDSIIVVARNGGLLVISDQAFKSIPVEEEPQMMTQAAVAPAATTKAFFGKPWPWPFG